MFIKHKKCLPLLMWLFPVSFFAYQFILRLWPGLMMHSIMEQFSIDASHFGLLAAFYYYGYAGMQIPVALLLERFQPRYVICSFAILCGLATLLFTYTSHFYLAVFSRFLIGAGSAVGFLGVSKVISEWFSKEHYTRMVGFSFSVGLLGAIYGGKPVSLLIERYSWQNVAITLAFVSIGIGLGCYLFLRAPQHKEEVGTTSLLNFKTVLAAKWLWVLALSNLLMVGALEGFSDVWGVPYLTMAYGLAKSDAAGLISFVFFGMIFGGPLLAFCSGKIGNYPVIALSGLGMALAFIFLLLNQTASFWILACLFFGVGILCCYQVIVFAAGSELMEAQYLGVTIAFLNCINMLGGSFFHTLIGKIMDLFWAGAVSAEGLKQYTLHAYQYALSVIPICAILGAVMVCVMWRKVTRHFPI